MFRTRAIRPALSIRPRVSSCSVRRACPDVSRALRSISRTTRATKVPSSTRSMSRISAGWTGSRQAALQALPARPRDSRASTCSSPASSPTISRSSTGYTSRITAIHRAGSAKDSSQAPQASPSVSRNCTLSSSAPTSSTRAQTACWLTRHTFRM